MENYSEQTVSADSPDAEGNASPTAEFKNLRRFNRILVDATLTEATGGTLDVYLQRYVNSVWRDWIHFTQLAAGSTVFNLTIDPEKASEVAITTVGTGTTPALAAGDIACGHPGDRVRVLFVAGAGTSAGATQTITLTGISTS